MQYLLLTVLSTTNHQTHFSDQHSFLSWCENSIDIQTRPYCIDCGNCIETQDSCPIVSVDVPQWCVSPVRPTMGTFHITEYNDFIRYCETDVSDHIRPSCMDCANCIETQDSCNIIHAQNIPNWCQTAAVQEPPTPTSPITEYNDFISYCVTDVSDDIRPYCMDCANCIETQDSCNIIHAQNIPNWCHETHNNDENIFERVRTYENDAIIFMHNVYKKESIVIFISLGVGLVCSMLLNIVQYILYRKMMRKKIHPDIAKKTEVKYEKNTEDKKDSCDQTVSI